MENVIDVEVKTSEVTSVDLVADVESVGLIKSNIADVKRWLSGAIQKYENYVVTDDTLKTSEKDYQTLNKLTKTIDDKRKAIKKKMEEPIKAMESDFKECIGLIAPIMSNIKEQLDVYEDKRKQEKREYINEMLKSKFKDLMPKFVARFEFDEKWLNKTKKNGDIEKEATYQIEEIREAQRRYLNDLDGIANLVEAENKDLAIKLDLKKYLDRYEIVESFSAVLNEIKKDVEFNKAQYAEVLVQAKQEADKGLKEQVQNEQISAIESENGINEQISTNNKSVQNSPTSANAEWRMTFEVIGNFNNLKTLGEVMNKLNLEVKVLKREELN